MATLRVSDQAPSMAVPLPTYERPERRRANSLAAQSLAVGTGLLLSRALAFVRDMIIAYHFGASAQTDAYLIAAQVPLVFDSFLAGGALYGALMPIAALCFAGESQDERLRSLVSNSTTLVLVIGGTVGVLGGLCSPLLARVFGGGLNQEAYDTAIKLIAMTMLSLPFLGLTNVTWAALISKGRFWGPALAQSLSNITLIIFAFLFIGPIGIYALGLGYVVGAILQVLPQYTELYRLRVP